MRIALVVDHPQRDLAGLVLVATEMCGVGATSYLVPMNLEFSEICCLAPDVVLVNFLRRANERKVREYMDAGIQVVILETEGGILANLDAHPVAMVRDSAVRSRVRHYCSWGPRLADHCVKAGWFDSTQVVVTGAPRFDFYAYPWNTASLWQLPEDSRIRDPLVLVNGTFTLANPRFLPHDQEMKVLNGQGFSREFLEDRRKKEQVAMRQLAELTNLLARRYQNVTFVYRPHPFESEAGYRELLDRGHNILLLSQGDIRSWVQRARAVIQRGSTTAIEAALSGKMVLEPMWIPSWAQNQTIEAVSVPCNSVEEISEHLDAALDESGEKRWAVGDAAKKTVFDWFYHIDGRSHERVASVLLKCAESHQGATDKSRCRKLFYGLGSTRSSVRKRMPGYLRMSLGLPASWSFRELRAIRELGWDSSGKAFDTQLVQTIADSIAEVRETAVRDYSSVGSICAERAVNGRDYLAPNAQGRSVVLLETKR